MQAHPSNLYCLEGTPVAVAATAALARSININTLHKHLGHLRHQNTTHLVQQELVMGIGAITGTPRFCEACVGGKQHCLPFPHRTALTSTRKLELIHSDLCGPFPRSFGGKQYFITFIDHLTHKKWVYIIRKKSDTFTTFEEWKALVELESGEKVCCLCIDGGGKYFSGKFMEHCRVHSICLLVTAPDNPELNGLAEQANRTIVEPARSSLIGAHMSQGFWAEVVNTTAYIYGLTPISGLKGVNTDEAWSGIKKSIARLQTFGCPAYTFINKKHCNKVDSKTCKCRLLGYKLGTSVHRL